MPQPRPRLLALGVGALVVVVLAVLVYAHLSGRQTRDVAMPAGDATPEQVVEAYINALDAHDCETADALVTAEMRDSAGAWCGDAAGLTDVRVSEHLAERPQDSGRSRAEQVADVSVDFDLDWRTFHDDGSMTEGRTTWGYLLVRGSTDQPWRIFRQGVA